MAQEKWERINNVVCPWWLIGIFDNPLRHLFQNPGHILSGLVEPGGVAVDIGCGMGYFTIPLARLVGPEGRVLAIDLQEKMLAGVQRRAVRAGVSERIQLCQASPAGPGVAGPVDFVLTFWMVHEVPEQERFLEEIHALLRPGGTWLLAEPPIHVTRAMFDRTVAVAQKLGFTPLSRPRIPFSRAVLFAR
jgi:2-polyprenyl-3-methyl-5-hydroxy-6-metoxy-1,4-benzoquinol methylase